MATTEVYIVSGHVEFLKRLLILEIFDFFLTLYLTMDEVMLKIPDRGEERRKRKLEVLLQLQPRRS